LGTIGLVSGAILNIGFDALFIVVLKMGVAGASLATAISQFICWMLLLWGTTRPESVHVSLRNFRPSFRAYHEILMGGFPSLCRQIFNCVSVICLNHASAKYAAPGCEASTVAAFTVVSRTMTFAYSFMLGINQGFQPVAGFNYGAKLYRRVRKSYLFAMSFSSVLLSSVAAVLFVLAPEIISAYRDQDPVMLALGIKVLRYQCVTFGLVAIPVTTNMLFQVIRMPIRSTLLSIGRQGSFFLPALFILPYYYGLQGVVLTQPVADVATCLFSIPFIVWIVRKLNNGMQ
jgi:Na+-driven multidrug efflux pump